ncbi:MAG: cyclic nucleotide-binding domain-containing protein [Marinicaulis sp.]|nr:cyclic nucleotide-gated ion channel/potassium channel family protein [Marinicaulis sp.]NNE42142.1 cyclic nucleotide-binding domain-containing protein [Marinicaulis sp.]NNL88740.1 cyclic nucleotide-binding domain-containing protein [Marinicaulis sp.]
MSDRAHDAPGFFPTLKTRLYKVLESGHSYDWQSRAFESAMATLIILNVVAFTLETVPSIHDAHAVFFRLFDFVSILIFTAEYLARLWVCTEHPPFRGLPAWRARLKFARSPFMVVDFLAIAPYWFGMLFQLDLRVLRILRLLRFFKLARFSPAFNTMLRVLSRERSALLGVLIVLIAMIIIAASLLYLAEGNRPGSKFATVPEAMWWAIATLTTVGYGDVTPETPLGKLLAGIVMICGLGFFALPIGIIASGFMDEFRRQDFIVSWGMVARTSIYSDLAPDEIADVMNVLKARTAPKGSVIAVDGEQPGALFVVGSGSVLISDNDRPELEPVKLGEGDFWGAHSLLTGVQAETATAEAICDLIVLDIEDFRTLSRSHPRLYQKLRNAIAAAADPLADAEEKAPEKIED